MTKRVLIVGGGVIGLCTAYYTAERGFDVTVCDRGLESDLGCSYGNAGMITPSHFVPLAAPGVIRLALKWMANPESPFYMKPRFDRRLIDWAWKFYRAATVEHVLRSSPLLLELKQETKDLAPPKSSTYEFEVRAPVDPPATANWDAFERQFGVPPRPTQSATVANR